MVYDTRLNCPVFSVSYRTTMNRDGSWSWYEMGVQTGMNWSLPCQIAWSRTVLGGSMW